MIQINTCDKDMILLRHCNEQYCSLSVSEKTGEHARAVLSRADVGRLIDALLEIERERKAKA